MDNPPSLTTLRDERDRTITLLCDSFATDLVDADEFERRVDLAHRASSLADLEALRRDLPALPPLASPAPARAASPTVALAAPRRERQTLLAILGGATRRGTWIVPKRMKAVAIMGGIELDFREASFAPGVTELRIFTLMGGVEITVPPGLAVETHGSGILGGFDQVARTPVLPEPESPLLRITGVAMLGGVEVKTRLPGENAWQAWWRQRRERKQIRERNR